jgi:hypothetical protein
MQPSKSDEPTNQVIEDLLYSPEPRITALKPFQVAAAKHMIRWAATINSMQTGLGKTISTIAVADALDLFPATVVCGSRVALQWAGEFVRWLDARVSVSILAGERPQAFNGEYVQTLAGDETIKVPINDMNADVVIAPYSIVYEWANTIAERGNRVLVIDEIHRCANIRPRTRSGGDNYPVIGTRQAVACWYLARNVIPKKYLQHIYGLSADAVVNRPKDLTGILEILGRMPSLGGREFYLSRYCGREGKTIFGKDGKIRRYWDDNGSSNLEELHRRLKDMGVLYRVTKKEALPDMPDNEEIVIPVTLANQAEYDRAEADVLTYIREMALIDRGLNERLDTMSFEQLLAEYQGLRGNHPRALGPLPADADAPALREYLRRANANDRSYRAARAKALARLTVLRRLVGEGKVEAAIEWVRDFGIESPDEKMIIFAHHRSAQERLARAFPDAARIAGGQSLSESDENKYRFQHELSCKRIIVSEEAGGEGLNLSAGFHSLIIEWPWTAKAINQMLGRSTGRMDRPHDIVAWFLDAPGTIDDDMRKILQRKRKMSSMILDGREADGILSQPIDDEILAALEKKL